MYQRPLQVVRRPLPWDLSAADVLRLVRHDRHPVALLGSWAGGSDIIASEPVSVFTRGMPQNLGRVPAPQRGVGFGGGWIGYLGYGAAERSAPTPPPPGEPRRLPDSWFGFYDHVLRRDRHEGRWWLEALVDPNRAAALRARLRELTRRARAGVPSRPYSFEDFQVTPAPEQHKLAVRRAIEYIRRGDLFQANICLRMEAGFTGDPLDAFCAAATRLDPPYAAFLRLPDGGAVASVSPELFLRRTGSEVRTRPIKGTTERPRDEHEALLRRKELENSAKDHAENIMIVDLMRNDLSRVCTPGSVTVPILNRVEPHPGVWHLVSDVHGTLAPGREDRDLIRASFPPGSITGAPKVRALEVIHELESSPREVYTGSIGYTSPVAGLELNVAIRTFEFHRGRAWLGSGGGITMGSDPDTEYDECLVKARPLLQAVGAELGSTALPPSPRPRAALGVFASLRATDGRVHDLQAHLDRLDASVNALYGRHLPVDLPERISTRLKDEPEGRIRITARPVGGPLQTRVTITRADPPPESVRLHVIRIAGGLGAHKWLDRRTIDAARAERGLAQDEQLLIADSDGSLLETDCANLFAVVDGELHTPPADGRLLPGTTRAAVLRLASRLHLPVRESRLTLSALRQADEVFVTNAVHGIIPVRSLASDTEADRMAWPPGSRAVGLRSALACHPVPSNAAATAAADRLGCAEPVRRVLHRSTLPTIVLVDNYDSFTYNLAHLLLGNACHVEVVRNDEVTAREIADFRPDGIVISPGPGSPTDAGICLDVVAVSGPDTPLLGICLGHQTIAAAHGARITAAAQPVHGRDCPISHDGRGLLHGLPPEFRAARYHSLIVCEATLPPELIITARGPDAIPMGIRHLHQPTEGVQFHPESILTESGHTIIANFLRQACHRDCDAPRALWHDDRARS